MSTTRTFKGFTVINNTYYLPGAPTDKAWHVARGCEYVLCNEGACNCPEVWVIHAPDRLPEDMAVHLWDALRICRQLAANN
jgi:hypothetical protein